MAALVDPGQLRLFESWGYLLRRMQGLIMLLHYSASRAMGRDSGIMSSSSKLVMLKKAKASSKELVAARSQYLVQAV